jgi:hypothetical protein
MVDAIPKSTSKVIHPEALLVDAVTAALSDIVKCWCYSRKARVAAANRGELKML